MIKNDIISEHLVDASFFSILLGDQVNNFMRREGQRNLFNRLKVYDFDDLHLVEQQIVYDKRKVLDLYKANKGLLFKTEDSTQQK